MKRFCFTVDDNIIFLKEITQNGLKSIFDHPYLALYRHLHEKYDLKIQLNLFYDAYGFTLSEVSDKHRREWEANADWLKLSFHSRKAIPRPYENSGYGEMFADCELTHREILRFASEASLAKTTTIHYCLATEEGVRALADLGVRGLLGIYGTSENPQGSYYSASEECDELRQGKTVTQNGMDFAGIDIVLNSSTKDAILSRLASLSDRELIKVMIHEQYFYPHDRHYQPEFAEKLDATFAFLADNGFKSVFFENTLSL